MDVIAPIEPLASNGHHFILVAIDYFTKWVEASTYKAVTKKVVADFVLNNIVCRFGIPESIITDNAANFNSDLMKETCERFKIAHRNSTVYRSQMNGVVEAANKNIKKILRKIVDSHKQWHEKLPYALLGYRITIRTSTGVTPYMLVYGSEAVIPAEVEIPYLRTIQEVGLDDAEWIRSRHEQLMLIDEKRMDVVCHGQLYQNRMTKAFNKKVKPRRFTPRQLVLKKFFPHQGEAKGKFAPNWQGPYMVHRVLYGVAIS
ncbi:protein NYNRIN-like [Solanum tuberosum]|uniref:protein NYNRIN-like n=1 Tax=Solanum tuberosum TaxID=4113 RepID=UPI00073A41DF|nr:PREDICTED: protein NYNRIN-like [Solanum tuberosum]